MTDTPNTSSLPATVKWRQDDAEHELPWHAAAGVPPPRRVVLADDTLRADAAYRLACEGTGLLWQGDFHNARQLLQALARRVDRKPRRSATPFSFHLYRQAQAQRARILGMVLIPFEDNYAIPLRRAPDVTQACREAFGESPGPLVMSLRELQGVIGAHEWRKKGVAIRLPGKSADGTGAAQNRIHPHYGVFAPVRSEYLDLVARAPLQGNALAFDIGTGTGVLAIVLARRGVQRIVATDLSEAAISCARENIERFGYTDRIEVVAADLFPQGRADLIVCNPPWLPGRANTRLEAAVYDPDGRMLSGFLNGLATHLTPQGEGWLILSDLAEHLGLRQPDEVREAIAAAGLRVIDRLETRPVHPRAQDRSDPLHAARQAEVTSLWRLAPEH